ncbi:MAG: DUF3817 domain-containing protein [Microthrixaceae bacterium]
MASRWFERAAVAEAVTWVALLVAMSVKYLGSGNETGVRFMGLVHGMIALVYAAATLHAANVLRWRPTTTLLALLASAPPIATVWFEGRIARRGLLDAVAEGTAVRRATGGATPTLPGADRAAGPPGPSGRERVRKAEARGS